MILAGVDIETSGLDADKNHRLIQIGIAFNDGTEFVYDCLPDGNINIDAGALKVNGFTLYRIGSAYPTANIDRAIALGLAAKGYKRGSITPVGWNVGGFDMRFIKKELPETAQFFSYRVLDLTALAIYYTLKTGKPSDELKHDFKAKVIAKLGEDNEHDALYDAKAALAILDLFKEVL